MNTGETVNPASGRRSRMYPGKSTLRRLLSRRKATTRSSARRNEAATAASIKAVVTCSWLNVLLVAVPISWILHFTLPNEPVAIFIVSFIAIIPLAQLISFATEDISLRVGDTLAGLLNAGLGNVVEVFVAIFAIIKCELQVVQSSCSILSNLLLVLGMAFFAGGIKHSEQGFNQAAAEMNTTLLFLSVASILLPAAFHLGIQPDPAGTDGMSNSAEGSAIEKISRAIAVVLFLIYGAQLFFFLKTHTSQVNDTGGANFARSPLESPTTAEIERMLEETGKHRTGASEEMDEFVNSRPFDEASGSNHRGDVHDAESISLTTAIEAPPRIIVRAPTFSTPTPREIKANVLNMQTASRTTGTDRTVAAENGSARFRFDRAEDVAQRDGDDDGPEQPKMNKTVASLLLVIITGVTAFTSDILVGSINGLTSTLGINKEWLGLILIPIVGNAAEHVAAVSLAYKKQSLSLSISIAVGSSIQIALLVIPFSVIVAWMAGKPLLMLFDPFETATLFLSVLIVNYCIRDGKANWLEGILLMAFYILIAVSFWFYPGSDIAAILEQCK